MICHNGVLSDGSFSADYLLGQTCIWITGDCLQYSNKMILKALLLAPLPLLFLLAVALIIANQEFSFYSILVFFAAHAVVYLAYCLFTVPFSFLISMLLARLYWLNFFSIVMFSVLIAGVFFLGFGWAHTGNISNPWWDVFTEPFSIGLALIVAFSYWMFLIRDKRAS